VEERTLLNGCMLLHFAQLVYYTYALLVNVNAYYLLVN